MDRFHRLVSLTSVRRENSRSSCVCQYCDATSSGHWLMRQQIRYIEKFLERVCAYDSSLAEQRSGYRIRRRERASV